MKVSVKGPYKNHYSQPLFILKEEEKLEHFKKAIEKVLEVNLDIKNYGRFQCIYIPNNLYFEGLVAGLKIAEKESLMGVWLDIFKAYNFQTLPLAKYDKQNFVLISVSNNEYRKNKAIEKKLDRYFQELMTYLNHSLIIKYYPFDVELEIYVNCSISEYEEVKAKFLEFEKNNLDNKVLTKKENFMSENILQRIKHK